MSAHDDHGYICNLAINDHYTDISDLVAEYLSSALGVVYTGCGWRQKSIDLVEI